MDLESHGKSFVSIVTSYESHDSNDEPHRILDGGRPINITKSLQMGLQLWKHIDDSQATGKARHEKGKSIGFAIELDPVVNKECYHSMMGQSDHV